jgi:hypothetical protein
MVVTSYLRALGIPNLQYIDDRLLVAAHGHVEESGLLPQPFERVHVFLQLMTELGYTFSLHKCILHPVTSLTYLGFTIDTVRKCFVLPQDKREKFGSLREKILQGTYVDLKSLQKFAGKCASMAIAVPGALFYIRVVHDAISRAIKCSRDIELTGSLREEIQFWRF